MSCLVSIQDTCALFLANKELQHRAVLNLSDPNLISAGIKETRSAGYTIFDVETFFLFFESRKIWESKHLLA